MRLFDLANVLNRLSPGPNDHFSDGRGSVFVDPSAIVPDTMPEQDMNRLRHSTASRPRCIQSHLDPPFDYESNVAAGISLHFSK